MGRLARIAAMFVALEAAIAAMLSRPLTRQPQHQAAAA